VINDIVMHYTTDSVRFLGADCTIWYVYNLYYAEH